LAFGNRGDLVCPWTLDFAENGRADLSRQLLRGVAAPRPSGIGFRPFSFAGFEEAELFRRESALTGFVNTFSSPCEIG
jgi:hypothetical protein